MSTAPSTNGAHPAPADSRSAPKTELDAITLGRIMARSGLFPDITRASQAVVKILAGRELGIGPFAAMSDIHLVDGSPVVGARILAALVRQSDVYDYRVVEWTNQRCSIDFYRHGEKLEPTVTFSDEDAERAGLNQPTRSGKPSNHMKFPRNMKFARAMSNGVGLHCPDLTAGTPVYTPDELGLEDPERDTEDTSGTPHAQDDRGAADQRPHDDAGAATHPDLTDAALEGAYSEATVVDLCRFYYDQPRLTELSGDQATDMAGRLRLAHVQGVDDERLRRMVCKGLKMDDRSRAREAADIWLTFQAADGGSEADAA
jgi:hypothetical protein